MIPEHSYRKQFALFVHTRLHSFQGLNWCDFSQQRFKYLRWVPSIINCWVFSMQCTHFPQQYITCPELRNYTFGVMAPSDQNRVDKATVDYVMQVYSTSDWILRQKMKNLNAVTKKLIDNMQSVFGWRSNFTATIHFQFSATQISVTLKFWPLIWEEIFLQTNF